MIQPTKWSVPLGSGADVQDLPDDDLKYASFSKIFPQITQVPLSAGGVAPRRIDFNSLFKLLADNIYFYQNGGVFEYSNTADYEKGALVRYNDKIYLCIQDNSALNVHNPEDMDYWLRVALNNELADYLPLVGGNVTGNLTVQNKNVVRSVNGVNADAQGNIDLIPCGSYIQHAGDSAPSGFLVCNGGAISRTTYAKLFSVIGTKYGVGDGSTTFNLPNVINKFLEGSGISGTVIDAGVPNITGDLYSTTTASHGVQTIGCFNQAPTESFAAVGTYAGVHIDFNAGRSSAVYGRSSTVQPDAVTCLICIKY